MPALIGAVVGGLMAGIFALRAQKQAAKDQRQRDLEIEERAVRGSLQAIATELKLFKMHALDPLDQVLADLTKARKLAKNRIGIPPDPFVKNLIEQNYFFIFESNIGLLGRINDERLGQEIISVYNFWVKGIEPSFPSLRRHKWLFNRPRCDIEQQKTVDYCSESDRLVIQRKWMTCNPSFQANRQKNRTMGTLVKDARGRGRQK